MSTNHRKSKKRKICVVTGNRAEYSRVKSVMLAIQKHPKLELITIVTGAHLLDKYGLTVNEIVADGIKINERVFLIIEGENPVTMTKSVGLGIIELATAFNKLNPDVVVAPTDRFETLSVAVTAAMMNIPLVHIQGGEVSGTIDESIRHAITKFSHIHFPATDESRKRIIRMGEDPKRVFNVGCPATDLLLEVDRCSKKELFQNKALKPKDKRVLNPDAPFLLVIQHPVTTEFGSGVYQIQETLHALNALDMPAIMLWPNADAGSDNIVNGIRRFLLKHKMHNLYLYKHFPNNIFVNLMELCDCFVGNSSTGIRETCYFGTPAVNIGTRQTDRERGKNVVDVDHDRKNIARAIKNQLNHGKYSPEYVYGDGQAGKKVADILSTIEIKNIQKKILY